MRVKQTWEALLLPLGSAEILLLFMTTQIDHSRSSDMSYNYNLSFKRSKTFHCLRRTGMAPEIHWEDSDTS